MSEENMSSEGRVSKAKPSTQANSHPDSRRSHDNAGSNKWAQFRGQHPQNPSLPQNYTSARPRDNNYGGKNGNGRNRPWQNQNQAKKFTLAKEEIREFNDKRSNARRQRQGYYAEGQPRWLTSCYNKEQYVQATCQFIVCDEDGPYDAYLKDPDKFMDWEKVQELRLVEEELPTCPICLCPPVAAKMTRCGHIYCWACILHYLSLSDKAWRKCPICYESVYRNGLKSVVASTQKFPENNDALEFTLMKRLKTSGTALPCELWLEQSEPTSINDSLLRQWSKIVQCSTGQVVSNVVDREYAELQAALSQSDDEPELCFLHEALEALKERKKELYKSKDGELEVCSLKKPSKSEKPIMKSAIAASGAAKVVCYGDAFNEELSGAGATPSSELGENYSKLNLLSLEEKSPEPEGATAAKGAGAAKIRHDPNYYYFYQAKDGQRVFLHPLNTRMLLAEYGSWNQVPLAVSGRVQEVERMTMDDETRHRFKPLSHMPLTSLFSFAEVRFDKGVISKSTVDSFQDLLAKRRQQRNRKLQQEKRQEHRAEQWHKAVMIQSRGYVVPGGMSNLDKADLEIPTTIIVPSAQAEIEAGPATADVSGTPPQDFSFAQMLRYGVARRREHLPSAAAASRLDVPSERASAASFDGDEETLPAPRFQDSFGSALEAALESFKAEAPSETRKGRKKKNKGKVIFSL